MRKKPLDCPFPGAVEAALLPLVRLGLVLLAHVVLGDVRIHVEHKGAVVSDAEHDAAVALGEVQYEDAVALLNVGFLGLHIDVLGDVETAKLLSSLCIDVLGDVEAAKL